MTRTVKMGDYGFYIHNNSVMYHYNDILSLDSIHTQSLLIYAKHGKVIAYEQNGKYTRREKNDDRFAFVDALYEHHYETLEIKTAKLEWKVLKESQRLEKRDRAA
mgnify:FL=1